MPVTSHEIPKHIHYRSKLFSQFVWKYHKEIDLWGVTPRISIWVKKKGKLLFSKVACLRHRRVLFSRYYQKMRKGELFKLLRIKIEKIVSEVRKNKKNNLWNLNLGQNMAKTIFKK